MTDGSNQKVLSRRVVVASYAISVAGFLGVFMIGAAITYGNPWYGLRAPSYPVSAFLAELTSRNREPLETLLTLLWLLCPMVLQLLGLSGFVISLRRPERRNWFICGHVCLIAYYVLSALFGLFFALVSAMKFA